MKGLPNDAIGEREEGVRDVVSPTSSPYSEGRPNPVIPNRPDSTRGNRDMSTSGTVQLPIVLTCSTPTTVGKETGRFPEMNDPKVRIMARLGLLNSLSRLISEPLSGEGCSVGCGHTDSSAVAIKGGPPAGKEILNAVTLCAVFERSDPGKTEYTRSNRIREQTLEEPILPFTELPYAMIVALRCLRCERTVRREIHAGQLPREELIRLSQGYHSPAGFTLAVGTWFSPLCNLTGAWDAI